MTAGSGNWTVIRAGIIGIGDPPVPQVVNNAPCSDDCVSELSLLLNASWSVSCTLVTIDD
jgi:hypothetical protein